MNSQTHFITKLHKKSRRSGIFVLWRVVSQVLLGPELDSGFNDHPSNALEPRDSGKRLELGLTPTISSLSEVAAGRIASFHSYLSTFRVKGST